MSLNKQLTKIALYSLAKTDSTNSNLNYMIVGGLNVQIYAYNQFKNYLRNTIDADILVPNMKFKDFSQDYGKQISTLLKNKFDVQYHLQKNHNANTVTAMTNNDDKTKDVFLLSFTRYQQELYDKIEKDILIELQQNYNKINLNELDISSEYIRTKANINGVENLFLKNRKPELELNRKLTRIEKKTEYPINIRKDFQKLRKKILSDNCLHLDNMSSLHEQIIIDSIINPEMHEVEKDLYDYFLLKKILS